MASHLSPEDCNPFSAEMDILASDNIPFEVYSSMAELILSQQNVSACLSQSSQYNNSFVQKSESTCSQVQDWFQNILSQQQCRTLHSFPYSYANQSTMQVPLQHNFFEEDALEMDPLPGDLLHELNLKCEIPPGRNTPSPRLSTTSSASGGLFENLYSTCGDSYGLAVKQIINGVPEFCNNNINGGVTLKTMPPALMDLQPEPSESLTERASSLLDAATREGISAANQNGSRRSRNIRGRHRNSLSQNLKDDGSNKSRLSSVAKGQLVVPPSSSSFRPETGASFHNDNDNVFVEQPKALLEDSYSSYFSGTASFANVLINESSGSGCSSTCSSELLPTKQALRPSYSEVIKMSSSSSAFVAVAANAGRPCASSTSSVASSNTSPRRSLASVNNNILEGGQKASFDDNSWRNVVSNDKSEKLASCLKNEHVLSRSKFDDSNSFNQMEDNNADIENHYNNNYTSQDKIRHSFQVEMTSNSSSSMPLQPVLNNAKSLSSVNCPRQSGQLHHIVPPPPAASFIANDLKKRSNSEKERFDIRGRKSTSNNLSSGQLPIKQTTQQTSTTCEKLVEKKQLQSQVHSVGVAGASLKPASAAPSLATPRRSKSAKKKTNCCSSISESGKNSAELTTFASRLQVTFLLLCWRESLLKIQLHVQWLLWDVMVFSALSMGRFFFLRVATVASNAAVYVSTVGRSGSSILWRRVRHFLPNLANFSSGGARHCSGRRKKTANRKPAWMPPGLQAHIELPDTCEDAMKRLLACKEKDAYSILGVRRDAQEDEIAHYYKRQAFLVHPDKNVKPGAGEAFKILSGAFELVGGTMEQRREYDAALETARLQSEEAMEQFSGMVTKLQERMEEVMNTLKCDKCGSGHRRHRVEERSTAAARHCAQCRTLHSAREGDLWAEATCFGFRWRYYACMEDGIYNVTDFIACRADQFKQMMADSHNVLFRLSTANWRRFRKPQDNLVDLMEDLLPSRAPGSDLDHRATYGSNDEIAAVERRGCCRINGLDNYGLRRSKGCRRSRRH